MRDLVLREGLKTMAGDAALLLRDLLASGPGDALRGARGGQRLAARGVRAADLALHPRQRVASSLALDSFGTTCAALESAALAASYLEEMGVPEPAEARRRGELAGVVFLCRLWQGSTDFTLDDSAPRGRTIEELLELRRGRPFGEIEIAVPLRGFQMDAEQLELAGRDDRPRRRRRRARPRRAARRAWAAPPGSRRSWPSPACDAIGGRGRRERRWHPRRRCLQAGRHDPSAVQGRRRCPRPARVDPAGGDRWRRVSTGAGKPRPGGYRLADTELADLAGILAGACAAVDPLPPHGHRRRGRLPRDPRPRDLPLRGGARAPGHRSRRSTTTS